MAVVKAAPLTRIFERYFGNYVIILFEKKLLQSIYHDSCSMTKKINVYGSIFHIYGSVSTFGKLQINQSGHIMA